MGRIGFGYTAAKRRPQASGITLPLPQSVSLAPGPDWTGIASSGFAELPSNPVRLTAKPACRLIVPPHQRYTDKLAVGVIAMANASGSLWGNLGLSHVRVHYEGASVDIAAPTQRTFVDANGNSRTYLGWWVELEKPAGVSGEAHVFFQAVPTDPSMQSRVIGPFSFFPGDALYDGEIELAVSPPEIPGSRYRTLKSALDHAKAAGWNSVRVHASEAGTYNLEQVLSGGYDPASWVVIEGDVPGVVFTNPSGGYTTDAASRIRANTANLCWRGSNVTIDFNGVISYFVEAGEYVWLDGCNLTNSSASGKNQLFRQRQPNIVSRFTEGGAWFTEANATELFAPFLGAKLVRGCISDETTNDYCTRAECVIYNTATNHEPYYWNTDRDSLTVQYLGAGATATLQTSGTNTRTFSAKVDGATVSTFKVSNREDDFLGTGPNDGYTVQDVVDWLNSLTDWNATLIDDTWAAYTLGLPGEKGIPFPAIDVKATPATLVTTFDLHCDWHSISTTQETENVILFANTCVEIAGQDVFPVASSSRNIHDVFYVGNAFYNSFEDATPNVTNTNLSSQLDRGQYSHVVIAHNTLASQRLVIRTGSATFDGYCGVVNSSLRGLEWDGSPDGDILIADNHLHSGASVPNGATGTTVGGDHTDLYQDAAAGDFTPAGALAASPKASRLSYGMTGSFRGAFAPAGAIT